MYSDNEVTQEQIRQQVEEQLRSMGIGQTKTADPPLPQPSTLKINIAGTPMEFSSQEELEKTLNSTFSGIAEKIHELEQRAVSPQEKVKGDEDAFDMTQFADLLTRDPVKAFDYVDEKRYGQERIPKPVAEKLNELERVKGVLAVYQFKDVHRDFVESPENSQAIGRTLNYLNMPPTFEGLTAAYQLAKANGLIKNETSATQNQSRLANSGNNSFSQFNNQTTAAPPAVSRNVATDYDSTVESYLEGLSSDQLQQLLR
jgi:hypothetical protein